MVDGIDRTLGISDVQLTLGITKEATTGSFKIDAFGSKWRPVGEAEVTIWWDAGASRKLFGGYIVRIDRQTSQGHVVSYGCTLKNYAHLLDRKNVNKNYVGLTAISIIQDIVANYAGAGITTVNVDPDPELSVTGVSFNNIPPSQAIQKLADLLGYEWYVDENKDIHFFEKLSEVAPFALDDTGGKYLFESLKLADDFTQLRNSILVEGGDELSTVTNTDNFVGDGIQHTFPLSRSYSGLALKLNGVTKTVGVQNIDAFADHDSLYDFNLHTLYFDPSVPPGAGVAISVTARYYFPIVIRHREATSIGLYGEREFFIQDKSIRSRSDAVERALAELSAYARQIKDGGFQTYLQGLKPGQKITISSEVDAFTNDFIIQRMQGALLSPTRMIWKVDVVSVKAYELIDLLSQIIRGSQVQSPQDPVIVTAEFVDRHLAVARSIAVAMSARLTARTEQVARTILSYLNAPATWVAGPFIPPNISDRRRVAFTDRGSLLT